MKRAIVFALVLFLWSTGCIRRSQGGSETQTNLGENENARVARTFRAYRDARTTHRGGCVQTGSGRKVMVTGFGLFSGVEKNISGVVAEALSNATFLPSSVDTSAALKRSPGATVPLGRTDSGDHGAKVWNRSVTIDGQSVSMCIILLEVIWYQAAAIIAYEANAFRPEVLIMSGYAGGSTLRFESGALNTAEHLSGYTNSGERQASNIPIETFVLPTSTPGLVSPIFMTWNATGLADAVRPLVKLANGTLATLGAPETDPSNIYICNNVSFVVLHALRGVPIHLAGGQIELAPTALHVKAGFLHYPESHLDALAVARWTRVVAKAIATSLK